MRTPPAKALEALRLIEEEGYSRKDAAKAVGSHPQTINKWVKKFRPDQVRKRGTPLHDPKVIDAVLSDIAEGLSQAEVSRRHKVPRPTVASWVERYRVDLKKPSPYPEELVQEALRLYYDEGLSQQEVAERLGIDRHSVANWRSKREWLGGSTTDSSDTKAVKPVTPLAGPALMALNLWDEGHSEEKIAAHIGVRPNDVLRWVTEHSAGASGRQ